MSTLPASCASVRHAAWRRLLTRRKKLGVRGRWWSVGRVQQQDQQDHPQEMGLLCAHNQRPGVARAASCELRRSGSVRSWQLAPGGVRWSPVLRKWPAGLTHHALGCYQLPAMIKPAGGRRVRSLARVRWPGQSSPGRRLGAGPHDFPGQPNYCRSRWTSILANAFVELRSRRFAASRLGSSSARRLDRHAVSSGTGMMAPGAEGSNSYSLLG